jgi:dTDP-4-dehydrorhamnose reductase
VNGQVGFELQRTLASLGEVIALTRQEMDLADPASIMTALNQYQPTIIVNPAAYTAVDKAETDIEQAMAINAHAPKVLAEWAAQHKALLVHYSTDYVFDGRKEAAYIESDIANPQSVYGRSKWLGEEAIRTATPHHLILRTSWVFGAHGNNFLKTILRLAKERDSLNIVADQFGAPTSAALIASISAQILQRYIVSAHNFDYGTYHLCASGETTWCDYARFVVQQAEKNALALKLSSSAIQPIPTSAYPLPAPRPTNSRLDCSKLTSCFGLSMPHWQQGVTDVMAQL